MNVINPQTLEIQTGSAEKTRHIGESLGVLLQPGDFICLQGELGAGKTTFTQGIAKGWGSLDAVSSPTFIIVNVYSRADDAQLFHLDTYRLESAPEAAELDLDAMLAEGALIVEWPERMGELIPNERLWIRFEHVNEESRAIRFEANGARYETLLDQIRKSPVGRA